MSTSYSNIIREYLVSEYVPVQLLVFEKKQKLEYKVAAYIRDKKVGTEIFHLDIFDKQRLKKS